MPPPSCHDFFWTKCQYLFLSLPCSYGLHKWTNLNLGCILEVSCRASEKKRVPFLIGKKKHRTRHALLLDLLPRAAVTILQLLSDTPEETPTPKDDMAERWEEPSHDDPEVIPEPLIWPWDRLPPGYLVSDKQTFLQAMPLPWRKKHQLTERSRGRAGPHQANSSNWGVGWGGADMAKPTDQRGVEHKHSRDAQIWTLPAWSFQLPY